MQRVSEIAPIFFKSYGLDAAQPYSTSVYHNDEPDVDPLIIVIMASAAKYSMAEEASSSRAINKLRLGRTTPSESLLLRGPIGRLTRKSTTEATPTTKNAASTVFAVVELLEMILVNVHEAKTILLSQRVNKAFRSTILGSKKLQDLVFAPDHDGLQQLLYGRNINIARWSWDTPYIVVTGFDVLRMHLGKWRARSLDALAEDSYMKKGSWRHFALSEELYIGLVTFHDRDWGFAQYQTRNMRLQEYVTLGALVDAVIEWDRRSRRPTS